MIGIAEEAEERVTEADMRELAKGSNSAFIKITELTYQPLALKLTRDPTKAADLIQETFLKIIKRGLAAKYDSSKSNPTTYLMLIMKSAHVDMIRRENTLSRVRTISLDSILDPLKDGGIEKVEGIERTKGIKDPNSTEPYDHLTEKSTSRTLTIALRSIGSPPQRQVAKLVYETGCTLEETAGCLQVPIGTVKSRLSGFLTAAREYLDDQGELDLPSYLEAA